MADSKTEATDPLQSKPKERDLRTIADNSGNNLERLLTYVGLDNVNIQSVKLNHPGNVANACFAGLVLWRGENTDEPATWSTLLAAMKEANMAADAREWKKTIIDRQAKLSGK